jgi:hypothetical protein
VPFGLSGRVRGLRVCEDLVFADRELREEPQEDGRTALNACREETLDAGPRTLPKGGKID